MYTRDDLFTAPARRMSFNGVRWRFFFFCPRHTDVYFTSSAPFFFMHYSKCYKKNCHFSKWGNCFCYCYYTRFCIQVHSQYRRALLFFTPKGNKLSTAPPHLLLDDIVSSRRVLQPVFFYSSYLQPSGSTIPYPHGNMSYSCQFIRTAASIVSYCYYSAIPFRFFFFFQIKVSERVIRADTFIKQSIFNKRPFTSTNMNK